LNDRRRDGGSNFILRIKKQETRVTLHEHDDDDDDAEKPVRSGLYKENFDVLSGTGTKNMNILWEECKNFECQD